jgi:hypothetical protein
MLKQADVLYSQLDIDTQTKIQQYHTEGASLPFCLQWGLQASEELLAQHAKNNLNQLNHYAKNARGIA